ncbi:MAG TPA: DUF748 domain-containing protein [Tepidisphaeraceae bacterium]|nr:DUF748 domain-containing protein [Tepidisphaeraceae bacterium]
MSETKHESEPPAPTDAAAKPKKRKRRAFHAGVALLVIVFLLVCARLAMPWAVREYVNRTINQSPLYNGRIGDIDIHLWRGAYSIEDIRLNKVTGSVPAPLFHARKMDLAIEWDKLLNGALVGRVTFHQPQLNFVDGESDSEDQTGAGGPWLEIIDQLFPFRINSAVVKDGQIRFVAAVTSPPVEMSIDDLQASVENLTNIHDEVTPLVATVTAEGLAMGHAMLEYEMKIDPFSYKPTFQMAFRLLGLDVTKTNDLTRAYGSFDFEDGWFDLVIEMDAKEGQLDGYVKPLFRDVEVISRQDVREDNALQVFWEALIGGAAEILKNQPRDQVATLVEMHGDLSDPNINVLEIIGNLLRNAFIRAYLPRLEGVAEDVQGLHFGPGSVIDPAAADAEP